MSTAEVIYKLSHVPVQLHLSLSSLSCSCLIDFHSIWNKKSILLRLAPESKHSNSSFICFFFNMANLTHSTGHGTGYGNITLLNNPELCTLQTCDLSMSSFLYLPTLPGNAVYAAIFGLLLIGQIFLGIKYKTWGYMVAMIFGLVRISAEKGSKRH